MPDRRDANLFEILVGQVTQNNEIDIILGKALSVLPETELFEPVRNLLHRRPSTEFHAIRSGPACRGSLLTLAKIEYPGPASARPIPNKACSGVVHGSGAEKPVNVPFGSGADISQCNCHVCFTPESGHVQRKQRCPLWAISGHSGLPRTPGWNSRLTHRKRPFRWL